MKFLFAISISILLLGCYKESYYKIDSDKSKNLFQVFIDKNSLPADSFSTAQITVIFDNSVDSTKATTVFTTNIGAFVESNSKTYKTTPTYNYDSSKIMSTVKIRSPLAVDSGQIKIQVAGYTKSILVKFNRSFPDLTILSSSTLAIKPKNNQEGEISFSNRISRNIGFPSVGTVVDLEVFDSSYRNIGTFRNYSNKSDGHGTTSYVFVLGDSIANGSNYQGKLYAVSKVQTSDNPLQLKKDTVVFISTK
jgi:hypothetical protein